MSLDQSFHSCCPWQQGRNDALRDESDGKLYCGTCWQGWISKELAKSRYSRVSELKEQEMQVVTEVQKLYIDDDSVGELEAVPLEHDEAGFFIISRKLGIAFDMNRNDAGLLQRIGYVDRNTGAITLDNATYCEPTGRDGLDAIGNDRFPFKANPADHCETPLSAYRDIAPVLKFIAETLGKSQRTLSLYDPYFCNGAVKRHLASLGFPRVYNRCEDFYERIAERSVPPYDCLVTNPPYMPTRERDHLESLIQFVTSGDSLRPWFILQPNYVYTKPFWQQETAVTHLQPRPFYLTPRIPREYVYETPLGLRERSSSERKTSPFVSFWYVWMGQELTHRFYKWWVANGSRSCPRLSLACTEYFIPDNFKDSSDKTRRKKRKKKRMREHDEPSPFDTFS